MDNPFDPLNNWKNYNSRNNRLNDTKLFAFRPGQLLLTGVMNASQYINKQELFLSAQRLSVPLPEASLYHGTWCALSNKRSHETEASENVTQI